MFDLVDSSLERYLRRTLGLAESDLDVSFDAPSTDWGASLAAPTVNLFLWNLQKHPSETASGMREQAGAARELGRVRVAAQYVASAWAADVRDEHRLLGMLFSAVVANPALAAGDLDPILADTSPAPSLRVGALEDGSRGEFWTGLGGRVRASIDLVVGVTMPSQQLPTGAPISRAGPRLSGRRAGWVTDPDLWGATVSSRTDKVAVGPNGAFMIVANDGDQLTIDVDPPISVTVPSSEPPILVFPLDPDQEA